MDEMPDEEAGGFSVEAGYEKDGKYAKIKWEKDELDDEEVGFERPPHTRPTQVFLSTIKT